MSGNIAEWKPGIGPVNCNRVLQAEGKAYPRSCNRCGWGPCPFYPKGINPYAPEQERADMIRAARAFDNAAYEIAQALPDASRFLTARQAEKLRTGCANLNGAATELQRKASRHPVASDGEGKAKPQPTEPNNQTTPKGRE